MQTNIMGFFLFVVPCSPRVVVRVERVLSHSLNSVGASPLTMEGTMNERVPGGGAVTIFRRGGKKLFPVLLLQSAAARRGRTDLSLD